MASSAIDEYLAVHGNGETFDSIMSKPPIKAPAPFDGSQPFNHYLISSSHNTYLLANQLWGAASPKAYTSALNGLDARAPARCVEIDAWYTKKGPIVTHGHTFTGSIPFKDVCQAIADAVTPNSLPVFISLECHVEVDKQPEIVQIMKETWGDKLVSHRLQHLEGKRICPDDLRGRILMMVEWYPTPGDAANVIVKLNEEDNAASSSSEDDSDNSEVEEMKAFRKSHHNNKAKISDALASLGVYSNSIKPKDGWLEKEITDPLHALINISESQILALLKKKESLDQLIHHGQQHMRRCYPMGLRVDSDNMDPMPIWRCGTHVVGLNMQHWDKGTHINGALFRDTEGYILKPESLIGGKKRTGTAHLKFTVVGGDNIPRHKKDNPNEPVYIDAKLYTHEKTYEWKTKTIKEHNGFPIFDQSVEWSFSDDDLIFLKVELKRSEWAKDEELASYSVLVDRLENGLRFWPLFDSTGSPSLGHLLVNVEYLVE